MSATAAEGRIEIRLKDFSTDLSELPAAIVNRLERERWSDLQTLHKGLPTHLKHMTMVSGVTWEAIRVLVVDKRFGETPPARFAVTVAPLSRTLLESLMTTVFIFEDPTDRLDWYYRSGWREAAELQTSLTARFASQPEWAGYLAEHRAWVDYHVGDLGLTATEAATPKLATAKWNAWWPNPGRMVRLARGARSDFLDLLNSRYYGELSADAHLSYMGLVRRGGILRDEHAGANIEAACSAATFRALKFYVALLSEIAASATLPYEATRLIGIWKKLIVHAGAKELWDKRYATLLQGVQ